MRIVLAAKYPNGEAERIAHLIGAGEFSSEDPEIQLLCDADSISFFDNNIAHYIEAKGTEAAREKMRFMYERASE